ncbi:hypothetical protein ABPG74_012754 [Tetrahymena malaccensis]
MQYVNTQICQLGLYPDMQSIQCSPCDQQCLYCFGPGDQCYGCKQNYYLLDSKCVQVCPVQYFNDQQTLVCKRCIDNCDHCQDEFTCQQCSKNFIYDVNLQMCKSNCKDGMVLDLQTNKCKFICRENEIENKISNYCQRIIDCYQIQSYSLNTFLKTQIQGIVFNNQFKQFITYDSLGGLQIWNQETKLLIKSLNFHINSIVEAFILTKQDMQILISYDSLRAVVWFYYTGSILQIIPTENKLIIGSSIYYDWQVLILKTYDNQYFFQNLQNMEITQLDISALDQNSLAIYLDQILPVFFDQLGVVNIYRPVFDIKQNQNRLMKPIINLKFQNITIPRQVGLVKMGNVILIYCYNFGIEYILVDWNSKVLAQQVQLVQFEFYLVFCIKQVTIQEQMFLSFAGQTTKNQIVRFLINPNNNQYQILQIISDYQNYAILNFFFLSNQNPQTQQQYICIISNNTLSLFDDDMQSIIAQFGVSHQYNYKVQINEGKIYIFGDYVEVYNFSGREYFNIQPDIMSNQDIFPSAQSYNPTSLSVIKDYLVILETQSYISLWSYPNLHFIKRAKAFKEPIQTYFLLESNSNIFNQTIAIIGNQNNYLYSFPQFDYLITFGLTYCKFAQQNIEQKLIYMLNGSFFQVINSTDFSIVNQVSINFRQLNFLQVLNKNQLVLSVDQQNFLFFTTNGTFIFSYNVTQFRKSYIYDNKIFTYNNSMQVYLINDVNNQDVKALNFTLPTQIMFYSYISNLNLILMQTKLKTVVIYQFDTNSLIQNPLALQDIISYVISTISQQIIMIMKQGKIVSLIKANPIQIQNFENTSASPVISYQYDQQKSILIVGRKNGQVQMYDQFGQLIVEYNTTPFQIFQIFADFENNIIISVDNNNTPRFHVYPPNRVIQGIELQNATVNQMFVLDQKQMLILLVQNKTQNIPIQEQQYLLILNENDINQIYIQGYCINSRIINLVLNTYLTQLVLVCSDSSLRVFNYDTFTFQNEVAPIFPSYNFGDQSLLNSTIFSFSFGNPCVFHLINCLDWKTSWTIFVPNFNSYDFILNQNHNVIIITDGLSKLLKYDLIQKNFTKQANLPNTNYNQVQISEATSEYFMVYQYNNFVALHSVDNLNIYSSLIPINLVYLYQIYELNQVALLLTNGDILFYSLPQLNLVYQIKGISQGDQQLFFNRRNPNLVSSYKGIKVIDLISKNVISQKSFNQDILQMDVFFELSFIQVKFDKYSINILDLLSLNTIQVIKMYQPIQLFQIFPSNEKAYFCLSNGQLQIIDLNQIFVTRQLQQNDSLIPYSHNLPTAVLSQQNQNQFFYFNYVNNKLCSFRPIYQQQDNLSDLLKNGGQISMHTVGENLYVLVDSVLLVYLNIRVDLINSSGSLNENLFQQKIKIQLYNCCKMIYYTIFEQSVIYLSSNFELIRVNLTDSSTKILYKNQQDFLDILFYESKNVSDVNGYFWMVILEKQQLIVFDLKTQLQQQILQLENQPDISYLKISYNYEQFKQRQDQSSFIFMKLTKYSQFTFPPQTEFPLERLCIYQSDWSIFVVDLSIFLKQGIPISSDPQKFYLQYKDQRTAVFKSVLSIVVFPQIYFITVLQPGKIEIFQTLYQLSLQRIVTPSYSDYKISLGLSTFVVFNKVQFLLINLSDFTMMNFFSPALQQINEFYIIQENLFLVEQHNKLQIFSIDSNFIQMMKLEVAFQLYLDWNTTITTNSISIQYQIIGTFAQVHSLQQQPSQSQLQSVQLNLIASSLENFYQGTLAILLTNQIEDNFHLSDGYIQNICKFTIQQTNQVSDNKYIVSLISQLQTENINQGWTSQRIVYQFQQLDTFSFIVEPKSAYSVILIRNTNTSEIENYYFTPQERVNIFVSQSYSFETPAMVKLLFQHVFFIFLPKSGFIIDSKDNWLNELIISDALTQQELDQVSILISNVKSVVFDQIVLDGLYKYNILIDGQSTIYDGQDLTSDDQFLIGLYNIQNVVFNDVMIMNYKQINTKNPLLVFIKCNNITINGFTFVNNIIYNLNTIIQFIDVDYASIQNIIIQNNTIANRTTNDNSTSYLSPIVLQFNATQTVQISQVLFLMNSQFQFIEMSNSFSILGNDSIYDNLYLSLINGVFIRNKISKGIIQILQINKVYFENLNFQQNQAQQNVSQIKQIKIKNFNSLDYIQSNYKQFLILVSDSKELSINSCDFEQNRILGSMIYIFSSQYIINHLICNLNVNQISSGGCLYIYLYNSQQAQEINTIMNSKLTSNFVRQGEGGAIYLHTSDLKLVNTTIKNNTSLVGGGIKYIDIVPNFIYDQSVFIGGKQLVYHQNDTQKPTQLLSYIQNNTANIYGANIGSVIHSIIVQYDKQELASFQSGAYLKQNLTIILLDEEGNQLKISQKVLEQLTKYQEISFTIQIVDYNSINQQQKITQQQQQQQQQYAPLLINGKSIKDLDQFNTTIQAFQFNVSFSGYPLKQSMFVVQTSQTVILDLQQRQFSIGQIQQSIKINFRDCQIGEVPYQPSVNNQYMECFLCQQGMYSIQKYQTTDNKTHACLLCPQTAEYCEKDYLQLQNGYWRESYYSDEIYYCEKASKHCVNNQTLPNPESKNQVNYCIPGYIGPLCMSCDEFGKVWQTKYYKFSKTECISEDMHQVVLVKGILYTIALSILLGLFTYFSLRRIRCYRIKNILKVTGIMMLNKSVIDYQSIFYIKQGFIYYILHFRIHQISLTNISQYDQLNYMLSNSAQIPAFYFYDYPLRSTVIPVIYQKIIRAFIYPLLPLAIIYIFYEILIKLKYTERKKYFYFNVALILFIMYHSSFLEIILMPLQCQLIGNTYRISFDTQFDCYSPNHIQYFLFLIFPMCLLTTLLLIFIGFKLYQIRKKLHLMCNQNYLGIIYVEFKDNYYYWVVLQTTLSFVFSLIFNIIEGSFFFKGLIFTLLNLLYLYLLIRHVPFKNKKLQNLCIQSNLTILIQFFLQVLILNISDSISQINEYSDIGIFQANNSQEYFFILLSQITHILFCLKITFLIIIEISLTKTYLGKIFYLLFKKMTIIIPQEFKSYFQTQINTHRVQCNWRKVKKSLFGSKLDFIKLQNNLHSNQNLLSNFAQKISPENKKRSTIIQDGQPSFSVNPQQTFELTSNDQQEIFSYNHHSFYTNQKLQQTENFSITNLDIIKEYKKKISRLKSITPSPLKRDSRKSNSSVFNFLQSFDDQQQSKDQNQNQRISSFSSNNFINPKNNLSSKNIIKINKVSSEIQTSDEILQLDNENLEKRQNILSKIVDFDLKPDSIKENSQFDDMEISEQSNVFVDLNNEVDQTQKDNIIEGINRTLDIKIQQKQFKQN